ncbi:Card1-like endonuclease domain-containing protein, partial [Clostridium polynesiense]|uniref:Card1-like endonuclease domain-containing protein n=1 Tax=Clostridium polynesiense TaxID=1325933 RepID=UPI00058C1C25
MSKAITKAQCLIVLIGRSAMPNLIAVITRLQKNGYVFFIHTEETRKIAENLQELLKKKKDLNITSELIKIKSYADPKMVSEELQNKFLYIKNKLPSGNTYIELNYTGGTKVISAIGFITFKEVFAHYNERLLLSYLDGEQSKIFINSGNKEHIIDYSSAEVLFSLEIKDVADVHKEMISEEYRDKPQKGEDATKYSRDIMVYIISHIEEREKLVI